MAHRAIVAAPASNPRADAALAAGCGTCNGWGSVITSQGRHELCLTCQARAGDTSQTEAAPYR
jgi:hypothetical protein